MFGGKARVTGNEEDISKLTHQSRRMTGGTAAQWRGEGRRITNHHQRRRECSVLMLVMNVITVVAAGVMREICWCDGNSQFAQRKKSNLGVWKVQFSVWFDNTKPNYSRPYLMHLV